MSKDIMLVSSVPTFMMNDLQQEYVLHDHAHILDPEAFAKVTAFVGGGQYSQGRPQIAGDVPQRQDDFDFWRGL